MLHHHHHQQQQQQHQHHHQHQQQQHEQQQQQAIHAPHHHQQQLSTKSKADTRVTFGAPPVPPQATDRSPRPPLSSHYHYHHHHEQQQQQQQQQAGKPRLNSDTDAICVHATFQQRPLKRSQSLESRDNPFVPGGELSIDTDDILKRATIVRDRFILDEEEKKKKAAAAEEEAQRKKRQAAAPGGDASLLGNVTGAVEGVKEVSSVEEGVLEADSAKTQESEAAPPDGPDAALANKEDGRGADKKGTAANDTQDAAVPKEKKKQKKKCCTIM